MVEGTQCFQVSWVKSLGATTCWGVLYSKSAWLIWTQCLRTYQVCSLGRLPLCYIHQSLEEVSYFLTWISAWDSPAFSGGVDLCYTKNISDSVTWSSWHRIAWGKQESYTTIHCAEFFMHSHLSLSPALWDRWYYLCCTGEETEASRFYIACPSLHHK